MNELTLPRIREIVTGATGPCVSLFLPTHRKGVDLQQDPIRLENLIRDADRRLQRRGVDEATIHKLLSGPRARLPDHEFWAHQLDGLALLCSTSSQHTLRVPLDLPEFAAIGDRPYLKPLLPLLDGGGRYRLLTLALGSVRVFEGARDGLRALDIPGLPQRLEDVVGDDIEQKSPQQHSGPGGRGIGHGQGEGSDDTRIELDKFVRAVDAALYGSLEGRILPLVLAGVDHVTAAYRQITRANRLVDETLSGNVEHLDAPTLHQRSWPLVEPLFAAELESVQNRVREGLGTGKVVQRIEEVVIAARDGRVETLLVAVDTPRWGRVDGDTVELVDQRRPGDEDLVDRAATDTLMQGGRVHALPKDELPGDDAKALAVLRW